MRALARKIGGTDRSAATRELLGQLGGQPEFLSARTIAFYAAIADEVPLDLLAASSRERGARIAYPVQSGVGLELALVSNPESLCAGPSGVREPDRDALRIGVDEVDAFLVPGLLFDRACRRLGRGGGHYDRLLARAREDATLIGICYADRVVEELPEDPWDVPVDWVVTDRFVVERPVRGAGS